MEIEGKTMKNKITSIKELDKAIENWKDNEDIQRVFEAWKADKIAMIKEFIEKMKPFHNGDDYESCEICDYIKQLRTQKENSNGN